MTSWLKIDWSDQDSWQEPLTRWTLMDICACANHIYKERDSDAGWLVRPWAYDQVGSSDGYVIYIGWWICVCANHIYKQRERQWCWMTVLTMSLWPGGLLWWMGWGVPLMRCANIHLWYNNKHNVTYIQCTSELNEHYMYIVQFFSEDFTWSICDMPVMLLCSVFFLLFCA